MIEDIRNIKSTKKDIRECVLTVGIVYLAILSWILFLKHKPVHPKFFIAGTIFIALGLLFPAVFKPFQKIWMAIAAILGFFMSRIILFLLFYLAITPIGLLTRLLGKDILDQKIDKSRKSYWHDRRNVIKTKESYENQY